MFPHLLLTSSWLFLGCAVIITAFDLTDVQTLEHTRQVGDSVAPAHPSPRLGKLPNLGL